MTEYFLAASIAQGVLLSVSFFYKKESKVANVFLGVWIAIICLDLAVLMTVLYDQDEVLHIYSMALKYPIPFLHGPLFYLYSRSLVTNKILGFKDIIHFGPFIYTLVLTVRFLVIPSDEIRQIFTSISHGRELLYQIPLDFLSFYGLFYALLGAKNFYQYNMHLKRALGDIAIKSTVVWTTVVTSFQLSIWAIGSFSDLFVWLSDDELIPPDSQYIVVAFFIFVTGYFGLLQPKVFDVIKIQNGKEELDVSASKTNSNSLKLGDDRLIRIKGAIEKLVEDDKIYLEQDISIGKFSKKLNKPAYLISMVINQAYDKKFSDFINSYRLVEAKKLLLSDSYKHLTILAIAHDSGFNSKSTFNAVFKKSENMTPSEFRAQGLK